MIRLSLLDYHNYAMSRSDYGEGKAVDYPLFGLAGEVGELANKWKKVYRDNNGILTPEVQLAMIDELGDCLWYVSALARDLGTDLEEVAKINSKKIEARRQTGTLHGSGDGREKIGKPSDFKLPFTGNLYQTTPAEIEDHRRMLYEAGPSNCPYCVEPNQYINNTIEH